MRAQPEGKLIVLPPGQLDDWPEPPAKAAYHGLAGDLIAAVTEHTEADRVALLATILTIFGALAGNHRILYQGQPQAGNLYMVLVGDSSAARKGTATSIGHALFTAAVPDWQKIIATGLGSGEGLVGFLKRREETDYRALIMATEFGGLLRVMMREGNILSTMLRDAFDGVPLGRVLAREDAIVLRHHVALLGNITPIELRDRLSAIEAANGFANRMLFLLVRRTHLEPFAGPVDGFITPFLEPLRLAVLEAQRPAEMHWSERAADRWENLYLGWAARPPAWGLHGALTARTETLTARLALVYAMLDRSAEIDLPHLEAADALVSYGRRGIDRIFGDSTGNKLADFLRRYLEVHGEATVQELRTASGRSGQAVGEAIDLLEQLDLVETYLAHSGASGGRRAQWVRWLR